MKKEYKIKDRVWIHLGERKLVDGRVVEIVDLSHLKEGHSPDRELYIIEIKTGIDDIYEVRDFNQISPDASGPINLFRHIKDDLLKNQRYLNKVGIKMPMDGPHPLADLIEDVGQDPADPTPEQIHAAIERSEKENTTTIFKPATKRPARKNFAKRKTPNAGA
jgi:hypothetical protein